MILFAISFLLVFVSSYFITSIIAPKKSVLGIIYLFLTAFAQIVLTMEILSLFSAIVPFWVLFANTIFFISSGYIWWKKSKPILSIECTDFKNRVINSFKLDKSLIWLFVGFCVLVAVSIFLCLIMPITNLDAGSYHVARSIFWVINHNLNHFDVSDVRNLCLPINSEILYAWVMVFIKKDVFLSFFSFIGFLLSIISIYNILGFLGYCTRKKLWVIFILSSLPSVLVQLSGTETDIIIAGLITSSIFAFWYGIKNDEKTPIFMSALAYALAVGTKTPAIIAIPGVGMFMLGLAIYLKKKEFYKPLLNFAGFFFINFLIFSSFNYILNFIQFGNFMGSESFMQVSKNFYGWKAIPADIIKYIFMFFDFTGFRWSDYFGQNIFDLRSHVLAFFHLSGVKDGIYSADIGFNRSLLEPVMGAGILGFLVFLPCLFTSFIKPVLKRKGKKTWFILGFASLFVINIITMSYILAYMIYNVRFVMLFITLSSPVFVYSYLNKKNPLKYIIIAFALFYLVCVSTHLWSRPFSKIVPILRDNPSISNLREIAECKNFKKVPEYTNDGCKLVDNIEEKYTTDNKILIFAETSDQIFNLAFLILDGYKVDFRTMEDAKKINFNSYNLIVTTNNGQTSTLIKDYENRKNDCKIINKKVAIQKYNPVPCGYIANPIAPIQKDGKSNPPFQVQCALSSDFLSKHNLEPILLVGVIMPLHEKYYIIYENKNLLLKHKNQKDKIL